MGPAFLTLLSGDAAQTGVREVGTTSTRVVVVLIPGFPMESIVFGLLMGMIVVLLNRRRRRVDDVGT